MARRSRIVGIVWCPADTSTMNSIAEMAGLVAEPAEDPGVFYLRDTGRNPARDVEPDLFLAFAEKLDEAERRGVIPSWTRLEGPSLI